MDEIILRNRLKELLQVKGCSINKLSGDSSSLRVKLGNQINKETTISADTLLLVLATFPDVSAEWLMRGEGNMFKAGSSHSVSVDKMSGGQVVAGNVGKVVGNESNDKEVLNKVLEQNSMLLQILLHGNK